MFKTYAEIIEKAKHFGAGVGAMKLTSVNNDYKEGHPLEFISIFAPNMEEWYTMDIGCMIFGYTLAPLYSTLGPDSVSFVINQT